MGAKTIKTIKVITDEVNPVDLELIAEAIIRVSDGFEAIAKSKLNERAVVLMLHELSGVTKTDIKRILYHARQLKKEFTK